jgi:Arylsulfotransferase (ASST)
MKLTLDVLKTAVKNDAAIRRIQRLQPAVLGTFSLLAALVGLAGAATAAPLQVSTQPSLFPDFNASIRDYVVRCEPSNEVEVSLETPENVRASVDGGPRRKGTITQTVSLNAGQSFDITVIQSGVAKAYFVRCLPSDFPAFTTERDGPTQAQWYIVAPSIGTAPSGESTQYLAFFDNNGVPVWWMPSASGTTPLDAKLLPNRHVAWLHLNPGPDPVEEHRLDGSLVERTLDTVPNGADPHDIQLLPNGDYVLGRTFAQSGVDMSSCGGPTSGTLLDFELQRLKPNGDLVWVWLASEHIPLSEVTGRWQSQCTTTGDAYHWNSVTHDGGGYVLSFRHLDAVYRIDRRTGAIDWKLGGVEIPESLTVVGDPLSPTFCGQHDARVLGRKLTVYDNGTGCNRPSRSVRFMIDDRAQTATLLEDVRDFDGASSICCGSTRRLPGGDWVTQWGNNPYFTEQTATGDPVFKLSFTPGLWSYRAHPVLPGRVSRAALRARMDAQYPRP